MIKKVIFLLVIFNAFLHPPSLLGQKNVNHEYPRIGVLLWGGGTPDWLSRFDLVIMPPPESIIVRATRTLNPNAYYLVTLDWMAGAIFIPITHDFSVIPEQWRVQNQSGTYLCYACNYYGGNQYMLDFTEYCDKFTGSVGGFPVYNERYNEALPRVFNQEIDWSIYDGVNSDGTWDFPHGTYNTGIDLDHNGLNDYSETGKGPGWIRQVWQRGHDTTYQRWRNLWGNNQKLITYWTIGTTPMGRGLVNGVGWERMFMNQPYDFSSWRSLITQWEQNSRSPRINWITSAIDWVYLNGQDAYRPSDAPPATRKKDYFRYLRWTLGWALLNDVYFMIEDTEHFYFLYYDEFDVKLGYPTGAAQQLPNGCWIRFFDNGVSIVNPTNSTLTVTNADLAGMSGYAGPYYRFRGNQDPVWNNGWEFTSVELKSTRYNTDQYIGDGILLVKKPTTVVSDIIVDNAYSGTSPGSQTAVLTGFTWDQNGSTNHSNPTWNTGPRTDNNVQWHRSHYAPAGSGSATAVFRPTINVSGRYNVYEWHGWCGSGPTSLVEASNVPCRIVHGNGTTDVTIDQTKNLGQWNLIGTCSFTAGGNASVTITNDANGYVIADAFKFEYVEDEGYQIQGQIFFDQNNNSRLDQGEPGLAGWTINLSGPVSGSAISDSNGVYTFKNLRTGQYEVSQISQLAWNQTLPATPILNYNVILAEGTPALTCNFGNYAPDYVQFKINKNWNILSLPLNVMNNNKNVIFPTANGDAYSYIGYYKYEDKIQDGKGYYVRFPYSHNLYVPGNPIYSDTVDVDSTWNLIGSVATPFPVDNIKTVPGGIISSFYFGYRTSFFSVDTIYPGQGYWVKASRPGKIVFAPGSNSSESVTRRNDLLNQLNSISFTTDLGEKQVLRFSAYPTYNNLKKLSEVPPIPPDGVFDVRYLSTSKAYGGSLVAIFDESDQVKKIPIRIQSSSFPVRLEWKLKEAGSIYRLRYRDRSILLENTDGVMDVMLASPVEEFELEIMSRTSSFQPESFTLDQNYPNPFNSSTNIQFSLPFAGHVRLSVYNLLGENIGTMCDRPFPAGKYSMTFDGSELSTGIYIYRIFINTSAGEYFTTSKRLLLIK